jgi:hypothetical protein
MNTIFRITAAQEAKIIALGGNPNTFHRTFDLPEGWVVGWAKGVYYGVAPDGQASS